YKYPYVYGVNRKIKKYRICISLKKTLFLFVAAHIIKGDNQD
ncbi:unnamed protein product, partial [Larinioides sclopetarius]